MKTRFGQLRDWLTKGVLLVSFISLGHVAWKFWSKRDRDLAQERRAALTVAASELTIRREGRSTQSSTQAPAAPRPTPIIGQATPVQVSRSDTGLLVANVAAASTTDEQFRRLVDEANVAAAKGGDDEERRYIARLIETQNFDEAERALLAIADRPGGASVFVETDLARALRAAGREADAKAFEQRVSLRMLATVERMEKLGLGAAAPFIYQITFWRANQFLGKGTPEWRRAFESLARVGASIPDNSTALQAGYVRSLGQWASDSIRRADPPAAR